MRKSIKIKIQTNTLIDVVDEGKGPVVVLIHGWPVTNHHWRKILSRILDTGYRALMITPRGLGEASEGSGNLDKLTIAREISSVLKILHITEYAVVGHDWGGTLGYFICSENREQCWALAIEEEILPGINIDIPKPGSMYYPSWHAPFNRSVGLGEKLIPGREYDYYGTFLRESSGVVPLEESAILVYLESYMKPSQLANTLGYYRTKETDMKEVLGRINKPLNLPILAIGGKYGMGNSVIEGMRYVGKNVSGIVFENAGHYPAEQEPDKFAASLLDFLKESYDKWRQGTGISGIH